LVRFKLRFCFTKRLINSRNLANKFLTGIRIQFNKIVGVISLFWRFWRYPIAFTSNVENLAISTKSLSPLLG